MKVCENAQVRQLADYRLQALQVSSDARVAGSRALVGTHIRHAPFFVFFIHFAGGNESGVGGDQKFDRVESTTETRATRCTSSLYPRHTRP